MFYVTDIDDNTQVVIEAETSSAFAKSDLEVKPNPTMALQNAMKSSAQLANRFASEIRPIMEQTGADAEVSFSMKCDHTGLVMLAMNPDEGQFRVTLRFERGAGTRPALPSGVFDDQLDATDQ